MKQYEDHYKTTWLSFSDFLEKWIKRFLVALLLLSIVSQLLLHSEWRPLLSSIDRLEGVPFTDELEIRKMLSEQIGS